MEADLQSLGVDYRDRFRAGPGGWPLLTLRRIAVLAFRHPVRDGHVVRTEQKLSLSEVLLDEVRRATTAAVTRKVPDPWPGRFAAGAVDDDMERRRVWAETKARWRPKE